MAHGARRAGAAVAIAAALLAFSDSAPAQPVRRTSSARQVERASAAAAREAQRVRAEARRAEQDVAALDRRLNEAAERRQEAEGAALESERRVAVLEEEMAAATRAHVRDRVALEAVLSACVFEERARMGAGRARALRSAFLRATAADVAAQSRNRRRLIETTSAARATELEAQSALLETQSAIDEESAGLEAMRYERRRSQATLIASAAEAERRAARLAREARSLADLARRVETPRQRAAIGPLGRLSAPVSGRLIVRYGQTNDAGRPAAGLTWRTSGGASVAAPARGIVGYAGPFRSYGHILILNLDNGYAVVLAGMADARKSAGDRVETGEIVGQMSRAAEPAPELYVEIRRNGRPIDPSGQFAAQAAAPSDGRAG